MSAKEKLQEVLFSWGGVSHADKVAEAIYQMIKEELLRRAYSPVERARLDPDGTATGKTILTAPVQSAAKPGEIGTCYPGPASTHVDLESGKRTPLAPTSQFEKDYVPRAKHERELEEAKQLAEGALDAQAECERRMFTMRRAHREELARLRAELAPSFVPPVETGTSPYFANRVDPTTGKVVKSETGAPAAGAPDDEGAPERITLYSGPGEDSSLVSLPDPETGKPRKGERPRKYVLASVAEREAEELRAALATKRVALDEKLQQDQTARALLPGSHRYVADGIALMVKDHADAMRLEVAKRAALVAAIDGEARSAEHRAKTCSGESGTFARGELRGVEWCRKQVANLDPAARALLDEMAELRMVIETTAEQLTAACRDVDALRDARDAALKRVAALEAKLAPCGHVGARGHRCEAPRGHMGNHINTETTWAADVQAEAPKVAETSDFGHQHAFIVDAAGTLRPCACGYRLNLDTVGECAIRDIVASVSSPPPPAASVPDIPPVPILAALTYDTEALRGKT